MNSKLSWAGAALLGLLGATGCGASTATPDDLARAVVGFLAANDFDGYLAETVISTQQVLEVCPATDHFTLDVAKFRDHFETCREAFDFSDASVTTVSPKLETRAAGTNGCGNAKPLNSARSIEVKVEGSAGTYEFTIDDSVEGPAGWRQLEDLNCPGATPNCNAYAKAVESCCAKPSADKDQCDTMVASAKAVVEIASQVGTDCGPFDFTCPFN